VISQSSTNPGYRPTLWRRFVLLALLAAGLAWLAAGARADAGAAQTFYFNTDYLSIKNGYQMYISVSETQGSETANLYVYLTRSAQTNTAGMATTQYQTRTYG
jgi:hypothetical protein